MNFLDMFPALSSFSFGRGNSDPGSSFSVPSDPFQKMFLHIHRVIVIVDLITKILLSKVQNNMYVLQASSFPTLPIQQAHEVIVVKKTKLLESAALEESEKREGASSTYILFCTFDKMSFNLRWARKTHRFDSVNDAVPGNHLPCRNHTYRYVDTRLWRIIQMIVTAPGTSQEVNRLNRTQRISDE